MDAISQTDRQVVSDLAKQVAAVAADPIQQARLDLWRRHNRMQRCKPPVLVYVEDAWDEFIPPETYQCTHELARGLEVDLRRRLYAFEHIRDDRPVTANVDTYLVIDDPGLCTAVGETIHTESPTHQRTGVLYAQVLCDDADPEAVFPKRTISGDWETTRKNQEQLADLVGDWLDVRIVGANGWCACALDYLVFLRGAGQILMDLVDRPQWIQALVKAMIDSELDVARQCEAQGLLGLNNGNNHVGSGGIGATDELPADGFDGERVRFKDQWGFGTEQILSEVSPEMHWELALQHEMPLLKLFGLNCYGCCEPLHKKMDMVRRIPRLRRVSMSPFVDWAEGAEAIGGDFIYSAKPNPSYLTTGVWDIEPCRREIETILAAAKANGCVVEFVLNGTLTSRNEPHRYQQWTDMVQQFAEAHV
ncbi:hypothetical protein LCGC14_0124720 [marine sediment metagenome]|uniref:Uroporphyrinogen decarboxylase (URO-D) domain-containing protein n=1 Tax=marine sediment metagenome TaxID=412755 RepID=A0A0F9VLD4_9ZZZZ|nr:hypothetical protein [Phycisphaerae bacterium]HDZ43646.1 hypothetical protein [Phycisphaerae bacterium]